MATNSIIPLLLSSFLFLLLPTVCFSWQVGGGRTQDTSSNSNIRRAIITSSPFLAINSLSTIVRVVELYPAELDPVFYPAPFAQGLGYPPLGFDSLLCAYFIQHAKGNAEVPRGDVP